MLPLDNRSNERPDWAEYWPIRRFLQNESLDENAFYGFLSPRMREKLPVTVEELMEFISTVEDGTDVAAFSPFFDHQAIFRNLFEQGEFTCPGFMDISRQVFEEALPELDLRYLVNTSATAILCNYFAAKPRFWRSWFSFCERIFDMAESPNHVYKDALCNRYIYGVGASQVKVFIIERMASLLLAATSNFRVEKFAKSTLSLDFHGLPYSLLKCLDQLKADGLKVNPILLDAFTHIQGEIFQQENFKKMYEFWIEGNRSIANNNLPSHGYEHWRNLPRAKPAVHEDIGLRWLLRRLIH